MRRRYVLVWSPGGIDPRRRSALAALAAQADDLHLAVDRPDLVIVADPALPLIELAGGGWLLGTAFDRGATQPVETLDDRLRADILASHGRLLCERFWGNYLAVLPSTDGARRLLRAPFGDLGVCVAAGGGVWLVGSDAAILAAARGERFALDADALARHLAAPELVGTETCLLGVHDVRGGECRTLRGPEGETQIYWSPWRFTTGPGHREIGEAVRAVRGAVATAVKASVSPYAHVLLFLSGGLDSSIVARCLVAATHPVTALNLVTDDPVGDERRYAAAVAEALDVALVEVGRRPEGIDFERSLAAALPRPMARAFSQESERIAHLEADRIGATALVDGSGGDNVFCSHRSVAAIADCLLTDGFGQTYRATAEALADLTGAGLPRILFQSLRRAWLRPAGPRWHADTSFLTADAALRAVARPPHPWFTPPRGVLPGRALHISLLAAAQSLVEAGSAAQRHDRVSPLMSQPVAEACLAVPSWLWFARGHDRAVARRAFANELPSAVINRRSKGTPAPFVAAILAERRQRLKPFLLDGVLSGLSLLDRDRLAGFLDDPAPARGDTFARILTLIDAEAWARCWS